MTTTPFMQVMSSSATPEWGTPARIIERVLHLFGTIDLDPCSNSHSSPHVPARIHYTKEDDGLSKAWLAQTVYMNPPYGRAIGAWTAKLVATYEEGTVGEAIALVPGRIDTQWFQPLYEYYRCNVAGRLIFVGETEHAPFPSVAIYLGNREEDFVEAFAGIGPLIAPRIG